MIKILSIVIPTYNMAELLPRCLDSLVSPNLEDSLEVLVVNDGSKDNSLEIAKEYESRYPNIIHAIDKPNGNYGSAINKGIELATGKYFRICDSDDFYNNKELCFLIRKLNDCNEDLVLTDYVVDRKGYSIRMEIKGIMSENKMLLRDLDISKIKNYAMHSLTIKTSLLKDNKIELQAGISYTDIEYCYYPLKYAKDILYIDKSVYRYQVGREGQTVSLESQLRCMSHMVKIINRMLGDLSIHISDSIDKNRSFIASRIINLYLSTALCYDRSNKELPNINSLVDRIKGNHYLHSLMMQSNMFGIPFYKRYYNIKKTSNGFLFTLYYKLVKCLGRIYIYIR